MEQPRWRSTLKEITRKIFRLLFERDKFSVGESSLFSSSSLEIDARDSPDVASRTSPKINNAACPPEIILDQDTANERLRAQKRFGKFVKI